MNITKGEEERERNIKKSKNYGKNSVKTGERGREKMVKSHRTNSSMLTVWIWRSIAR